LALRTLTDIDKIIAIQNLSFLIKLIIYFIQKGITKFNVNL